ncbi:MAG: hypothetical protein QXJ28_02495, partial [Candidatus Pacearchaeota archaeon]
MMIRKNKEDLESIIGNLLNKDGIIVSKGDRLVTFQSFNDGVINLVSFPYDALRSLIDYSLRNEDQFVSLETLGEKFEYPLKNNPSPERVIVNTSLRGRDNLELSWRRYKEYPSNIKKIPIDNNKKLCLNCRYVILEEGLNSREVSFDACAL